MVGRHERCLGCTADWMLYVYVGVFVGSQNRMDICRTLTKSERRYIVGEPNDSKRRLQARKLGRLLLLLLLVLLLLLQQGGLRSAVLRKKSVCKRCRLPVTLVGLCRARFTVQHYYYSAT